MKRLAIVFTLIFTGCGSEHIDNNNYSLTKNLCGANWPCKCGDTLVRSRVMDNSDRLENCDFHTNEPALTIINGSVLDCNGKMISVELNNLYVYAGEYNSNRLGVLIRYNSSGSAVQNCTIYGFSQAIQIEFNTEWVKEDGVTRFVFSAPKDITISNNEIVLGEAFCTMGAYCSSNGVLVGGWPNPDVNTKNILIIGNRFKMARSPKTDKIYLLKYGAYIAAGSAHNLAILFNYFENINYGYGIRLTYDSRRTWIVGNIFHMPWERYTLSHWTPSGIGIDMYNGTEYGYPRFASISLNTFFISEDKFWPPYPFGNSPNNGLNHEYVAIRSGWGAHAKPIDARYNWWKRLDGKNYSDAQIRYLVYSKGYEVNGQDKEPEMREVKYLPRF